ncbi:MAG: hypothetical protein DWQ35_21935 [Planctomycetota bacterium]|nr:MAG: hypothetical protein DWQ35_21935 [Planctomycetota bacterium]
MKVVLVAVVLLLVVIVAGILAYRFAVRDDNQNQAVMAQEEPTPESGAVPEVEVGGEKLVLVPSSQSDARVDEAGLGFKGSEDVRHLLSPPAKTEVAKGSNSDSAYRPDDAIDWVVDVEFDGSPILQRKTILEVFDIQWMEANGKPEIYGWSPEDNHWTFLRAARVPETYTKLALGWSLFDPIDQASFDTTAEELSARKVSVSKAAEKLGVAKMRWNRSAKEAVEVADSINGAVANCNRDVLVVLAAPHERTYAGREIWDVMLCLGLRWGDMDLFHWENTDGSLGDDFLFSVWTSTSPGYFLPEEIAAGRVRVENLVFGYSIPRSADPKSVFESMMKAVQYAQERLGGEIHDAQGQPLDEAAIMQEIEGIVEKLNEVGFTPGEDSTLRVF